MMPNISIVDIRHHEKQNSIHSETVLPMEVLTSASDKCL